MRLVIDMNLSPGWVGFLKAAGFETVHWSEVGSANASDSAIMEFAVRSSSVVLTHDLDFGAILAATGGEGPSVVQIRADDLRITAIGDQIVAALRQTEEMLKDGALVTIDTQRVRVSVLPLDAAR